MLAVGAEASRTSLTRWGRARVRVRRNKLHLLTLVLVACLFGIAVFADLLAPYGPREIVSPPLMAPGGAHLLGTDEIGRDIASRLIYGARVSLWVGLLATAIAAIIGVPMGLASGYFGRATDAVTMRLTDGMLAFPPIILALAIVAVLGPNLNNTILAIGVVQIPRFARLIRGEALSLREEEFIAAARSLGASHLRILSRELAPNTFSIILVQFSLTFATAVLTEAALSFLGLGAQPPTPSWGLMLNTGRQMMSMSITYPLFAAIAIFVTVLIFTLLGDTLTDILEPSRKD